MPQKRNNTPACELLTVREAAYVLSVQPCTVRAWISERKLPSVRVGERYLRVPRSAVQEFVERNTTPADRRVAV